MGQPVWSCGCHAAETRVDIDWVPCPVSSVRYAGWIRGLPGLSLRTDGGCSAHVGRYGSLPAGSTPTARCCCLPLTQRVAGPGVSLFVRWARYCRAHSRTQTVSR
jgi:hypothetical protein